MQFFGAFFRTTLLTSSKLSASQFRGGQFADSAAAVAAVHSAATVAGCAATAGMALQLPPTPIRPPFRGSVRSAARASSQVPAAAELQGQGPTLASSSRK